MVSAAGPAHWPSLFWLSLCCVCPAGPDPSASVKQWPAHIQELVRWVEAAIATLGGRAVSAKLGSTLSSARFVGLCVGVGCM